MQKIIVSCGRPVEVTRFADGKINMTVNGALFYGALQAETLRRLSFIKDDTNYIYEWQKAIHELEILMLHEINIFLARKEKNET